MDCGLPLPHPVIRIINIIIYTYSVTVRWPLVFSCHLVVDKHSLTRLPLVFYPLHIRHFELSKTLGDKKKLLQIETEIFEEDFSFFLRCTSLIVYIL